MSSNFIRIVVVSDESFESMLRGKFSIAFGCFSQFTMDKVNEDEVEYSRRRTWTDDRFDGEPLEKVSLCLPRSEKESSKTRSVGGVLQRPRCFAIFSVASS